MMERDYVRAFVSQRLLRFRLVSMGSDQRGSDTKRCSQCRTTASMQKDEQMKAYLQLPFSNPFLASAVGTAVHDIYRAMA